MYGPTACWGSNRPARDFGDNTLEGPSRLSISVCTRTLNPKPKHGEAKPACRTHHTNTPLPLSPPSPHSRHPWDLAALYYMHPPGYQTGQFDCHGLDELLLPTLRVEHLEVRAGFFEKLSALVEHAVPSQRVLAQKVEQRAHLPRGLVRPPACLARARGSIAAYVLNRAWWNL